MRGHDQLGRLSRRDLLAMAGAAGVSGVLAGAGAEVAAPLRARAQSTLSPDQALRRLMDGNQRFAKGDMTHYRADVELLRQKTAEKQQPFAGVLSCADSRVPVEDVFDQSIGHVFVCRIAGNIATPEIIGSIEYGAAVLGTRVVMVLAHGRCGAVSAALKGSAVPGQIGTLLPYIQPAIKKAGLDLEAASKANAVIQAGTLKASPVLADLVKQGKLMVAAAYYDLASGKVALLT